MVRIARSVITILPALSAFTFYTAASPACSGHLPASGNSEGILAPSNKRAGLPVQTQRFQPIDELVSARMVAMGKLPPLKALRAFEAAARHMSFKAAADELGLTPTAISHQIRLLETVVGEALFRRRPRPLILTSAGEALFPAVRSSFDSMAEAFATFRRDSVA